jgi:hypothetical protein
VRYDEATGRLSVSGSVAVMGVNALIVKSILEHNPEREFYIEQSLALEGMYPHLVPNGLLLKINHQPLAALSEEVLQRDHRYWSKYLQPMVGDWLKTDTSLAEVMAFTEKVRLRHELGDFKGDPLFLKDECAQRCFAKLRSSIGGVYAWRLGSECPAAYQPKTNQERQQLLREADFAFRQALALWPAWPEAVSRYGDLLLSLNRGEEARRLAEMALKFEPENAQARDVLDRLRHQPERKKGG